MERLYTLADYYAMERGYHIQKIRGSAADGQMHYHKHYHLGLVLWGTLKHRQNRKYAILQPGDAFVVPPGYPHSLHFGGNTEIWSLGFDEAMIPPTVNEGGLGQFLQGLQNETPETRVLLRIRLDERQQRALKALLEILYEEQRVEGLPELMAAPALVCAVLYILAQAYYAMPYNAVTLDAMTGHNTAIRRCIRYVDRHFREKLTPESLAKQFGISRATLCNSFPQYAGMSLHKYISRKRILEAQLQIRARGGLPVGQIAREVGYEDESTFYRNFLRITGMSPTEYRNQCKEAYNSAYEHGDYHG